MLVRIIYACVLFVMGWSLASPFTRSFKPIVEVPGDLYVGADVNVLPESSFRVTSLINYGSCRVKDDLSSACPQTPMRVPEDIRMQITEGEGGLKLVSLVSDCRILFGELRAGGSGFAVTVLGESVQCDPRKISVFHDSVFARFKKSKWLFVSAKKLKLAAGQGAGLGLAMLPPGRTVASTK